MIPRSAIALALLLGGAGAARSPIAAQTMRTFSASRNVASERQLRASLEFGAGTVMVRPAAGNQLYNLNARYDAERFSPVQQYESRTGILHIGLASSGKGGVRVTSRRQLEQTALFEFSPTVPLALTASLGASEATLELGGLTLTELTVHSGASRGTIAFSKPTRGECRSATFGVGATEIVVEKLANAACGTVRVEGGVGRATLDFGGRWRRDASVEIELSMGSVTLRVPRGSGVQLVADRFLSPVSAEGLVRNDKTWTTPDFTRAARKVTVRLKTAMVGVNVEWVD